MGHFCRLCQRVRPNEAFSGRGHRDHICKRCRKMPPRHRERIELEYEVHGFIEQSNISAKNIQRLKSLAETADEGLRELALLILEVARRYPRNRRRYVRMARENPALLDRLRQTLGDTWWDGIVSDGRLGAAWNPSCEWENTNGRPAPPNSEPAAPPTLNGLKRVTVHTDGACENNPGPGAWAALLRHGNHVKEIAGGEPKATNNRMELQAALAALRALNQPCAVEIFTDSKYLRDGITQWIARWKVNGWRTVERTPVKNQDLWQQLDELCARHQVQWRWLKGHAGHRENERCDQLARAEIARLKSARTQSQKPQRTDPTSASALSNAASKGH